MMMMMVVVVTMMMMMMMIDINKKLINTFVSIFSRRSRQ